MPWLGDPSTALTDRILTLIFGLPSYVAGTPLSQRGGAGAERAGL